MEFWFPAFIIIIHHCFKEKVGLKYWRNFYLMALKWKRLSHFHHCLEAEQQQYNHCLIKILILVHKLMYLILICEWYLGLGSRFWYPAMAHWPYMHVCIHVWLLIYLWGAGGVVIRWHPDDHGGLDTSYLYIHTYIQIHHPCEYALKKSMSDLGWSRIYFLHPYFFGFFSPNSFSTVTFI